MSDAFLLEMSEQDFLNGLGDAFRRFRDCRKVGNLLPLAESGLAKSSLVEDCLLTGEPLSVDARARGMDGLLHWVVDRLRPEGVPSLLAPAWRSYNVLFYPYLHPGTTNGERDKWTFPRLADAMGLSEQAIYKARRRALEAVSSILHEELNAPQDVAGRQRYLIERRYQAHQEDERLLLRLLSLLREPIPLRWGHELANMWQVDDPRGCFQALLKGGLLVRHGTDTAVAVHQEVYSHLRALLLPEEQQHLHRVAADYYKESRRYFEAVYHLRQGAEDEKYEKAASILLEHYQLIVETQQVEPLREQLALFQQAEVSDLTWARLKIAAGDVAFLMEDVDRALAEYGQALGTSDIRTKALAHYRRGKAFHLKNIDECLIHYQQAINLLETWPEDEPLLADIYIDRAWPYFQEKPDLTRAEANFQRAKELIRPDDKKRWVNLHNAWARVYYHQKNTEEELKQRLQAWLAATETQDAELMINMAHNLAVAYMWSKSEYEQALVYLEEGLTLAKQIRARLKEGMLEKTIGACYFFQQHYQEAIRHYLIAHEIFVETGNRNWQAGVSHDLAEAYAELDDKAQMKYYFAQALKIAEELGLEQHLQGLINLSRTYEGLAPPESQLSERQLLIFEHVKRHGKITKKECTQLLGVSTRTAVRDLNKMVDEGILLREGKGRGTYYRLNS